MLEQLYEQVLETNRHAVEKRLTSCLGKPGRPDGDGPR